MLNNYIAMGRICNDLILKSTPNGKNVLSFTIAIDRDYSKNNEKESDFISIVAWEKTAEFISKYFAKGSLIALTGSLRSRTYDDKNGTKHYVTEVFVDKVSFTGEKKDSGNNRTDYAAAAVAAPMQPQNVQVQPQESDFTVDESSDYPF